MSQHDMVIDNGPGLAVRTDINAAIQALASTNLGPVEPAVMYAGQLWLDTSVAPQGVLRQRDQSNAAWVAVQTGVVKATAADVVTGTDDTKFITALALKSAVTMRLTVITTSGTYTKPAELKFLEVTCVGGGGGGSGSANTAAGQASVGGGGGGGGTVIKLYKASDLAATTAYTIGAGGVFPANVGGAGGDSIFAGLTAGGGGGGGAILPTTASVGFTKTGGAGGTAAGGDLNIRGGMGSAAVANPHNRTATFILATAGVSFLAPYSSTAAGNVTTGSIAATAGEFPGGGAGGGGNGAAAGGSAGAVGGAGCIILKEYF
jgi:hypothetical protein